MGGLIRFVVFLLIVYLVVRWLMHWWKGDQPQVKGERREMPPPFEDRDVLDAKFTEIPSEQKPGEEKGDR